MAESKVVSYYTTIHQVDWVVVRRFILSNLFIGLSFKLVKKPAFKLASFRRDYSQQQTSHPNSYPDKVMVAKDAVYQTDYRMVNSPVADQKPEPELDVDKTFQSEELTRKSLGYFLTLPKFAEEKKDGFSFLVTTWITSFHIFFSKQGSDCVGSLRLFCSKSSAKWGKSSFCSFFLSCHDHFYTSILFSCTDYQQKERLYKVLLIGDPSVGKTSFVNRYTNNEFRSDYKGTVGVDFALKVIHLTNDFFVKLQLWDIAGKI